MKADMSNNKTAIYQIQAWLQFLSRVDSNVFRINPDGVYGPETEVSVRQYQLTRGLTPTGVVDLITWNMLKADYNAARVQFKSTPYICEYNKNK